MTEMLAILFLVTSVLTVSSQSNFRAQLRVTKILSDALDEYTPDGGTVCKRHRLEYREGLRDLKLWATQSKPITYLRSIIIILYSKIRLNKLSQYYIIIILYGEMEKEIL